MKDWENIPVAYKKTSGHLIFYIKIDFTRKARRVKNGHFKPDLEDSKYAGLVSRDSVSIAPTYANIQQTKVLAVDSRNAYLQAPTSENRYIICGLEFVIENVEKRALIVCALYGNKAADCDF